MGNSTSTQVFGGNSTFLPELSSTGVNGNRSNLTMVPTRAFEPLSPELLDLLDWQEENMDFIGSIGGMLLIVLGTVGNGVSIAVMRQEKLKSAVATIYLTALALVDTGLLWFGVGSWWAATALKWSFRNQHLAMCRLNLYLINCLPMLSSWVLVFVSVQRALVVLFPFKAKVIATRKKSYASLIVLLMSIMTYNLYSIITADLIRYEHPDGHVEHMCMYGFYVGDFDKKYWGIISLIVTLILPFGTLLIANVIIIIKVIQAKVKRSRLQSTDHDQGHVTKMTTTLVCVSIIFLILNMPYTIVFFVMPYPDYTDLKYLTIFDILGECATFLTSLNSAINFVLYCLTGPAFRKELKAMFCRCCCKKQGEERGAIPKQSSKTNVNTLSSI